MTKNRHTHRPKSLVLWVRSQQIIIIKYDINNFLSHSRVGNNSKEQETQLIILN